MELEHRDFDNAVVKKVILPVIVLTIPLFLFISQNAFADSIFDMIFFSLANVLFWYSMLSIFCHKLLVAVFEIIESETEQFGKGVHTFLPYFALFIYVLTYVGMFAPDSVFSGFPYSAMFMAPAIILGTVQQLVLGDKHLLFGLTIIPHELIDGVKLNTTTSKWVNPSLTLTLSSGKKVSIVDRQAVLEEVEVFLSERVSKTK